MTGVTLFFAGSLAGALSTGTLFAETFFATTFLVDDRFFVGFLGGVFVAGLFGADLARTFFFPDFLFTFVAAFLGFLAATERDEAFFGFIFVLLFFAAMIATSDRTVSPRLPGAQ